MESFWSQAASIRGLRVEHERKPDHAHDSKNDDDDEKFDDLDCDDKISHITISDVSESDDPKIPNSIIKYDSSAKMRFSWNKEKGNSLMNFVHDHNYAAIATPIQLQQDETFTSLDNPLIKITPTTPKPGKHNKSTILEQVVISKSIKKIINPPETPVILKGNKIKNKPLPILSKPKPDRDSDSNYEDGKESLTLKLEREKTIPRMLKKSKLNIKTTPKPKSNWSVVKRDIHENKDATILSNKDNLTPKLRVYAGPSSYQIKIGCKQLQQSYKKKKNPAHVTALLSDMIYLFPTPDVIRRVSTYNKALLKQEKETLSINKKENTNSKPSETNVNNLIDNSKFVVNKEKDSAPKTYIKQNNENYISSDDPEKLVEKMAQLDDTNLEQILHKPINFKTIQLHDARLAQILQEPVKSETIQLVDASLVQILQEPTSTPIKIQPNVPSNSNVINSPGPSGPLSPLDLQDGLQSEGEGLNEDVLMQITQLLDSSKTLQEVIDKQIVGKAAESTRLQEHQISNDNPQTSMSMKIIEAPDLARNQNRNNNEGLPTNCLICRKKAAFYGVYCVDVCAYDDNCTPSLKNTTQESTMTVHKTRKIGKAATSTSAEDKKAYRVGSSTSNSRQPADLNLKLDEVPQAVLEMSEDEAYSP